MLKFKLPTEADRENVLSYYSEKTILKNGGQLEDCRYDPEEKVMVKRYWVKL